MFAILKRVGPHRTRAREKKGVRGFDVAKLLLQSYLRKDNRHHGEPHFPSKTTSVFRCAQSGMSQQANRLMQEYKQLRKPENADEDIQLAPDESNIFLWNATIRGKFLAANIKFLMF